MKATRILSLILALIMLCSTFLFACGKEDADKKGDGSDVVINTEAEDESKKYDAKIVNLNGHVFRFLTRGTNASSHLATHAVYAEAPNGDKVNDAVYTRNAQLAEKYNCTIEEERHSNPGADARESLIAGDYIADFIMGTAYQTRSLASAGLLVDIASLDNIDLTKAWWDQRSMNGMNVGGKIFFVTGDACTLDDRAAWIMYFNKDWIEEYDASLNLYDEVRKGTWTVDLMAKLMTETAKDLDGDGQVATIGKDRFGYYGERGNNWFHVAACNVTVSKISPSGDIEIPFQPTQELLTAWEAVKGIVASPVRVVSDSSGAFKNGLSTFFCCNVGTMLNAGSTTISQGFLPLPKLNAEQENYHTSVSYIQLGSYCIPYTVENAEDWETNGFTSGAEQCAYFLEAFAYYSMNILTPAFYDQVILKQAVRDADSAEMVQIALANKIYDPVIGYSFGSLSEAFKECGSPNGAGAVGSDAAYDTFVSTYDKRYTAARKALQDYIKYVNAEDNVA